MDQKIVMGYWDEIGGQILFCLGYLSLEQESLEPLDGAWTRESIPKLLELAQSLGVRIQDKNTGEWL